MKIGMNLAAPVYFCRGWIFKNIFQMARDWSIKGDREAEVPLMPENGYPDFTRLKDGQIVMTSIFNNADGHYPAGNYIYSQVGVGEVSFPRSINVLEDYGFSKILEIDPSKGGAGVFIHSSNPENPITGIRLTPVKSLLDFGNFQREYIDHVKRFDTVRFMDWQMINHVLHAPEIEKRTQPFDIQQAGHGTGRALPAGEDGVAIELMVELCNRAKVNPWFCMYHLFNEEYVRLFATIVRDNLDPNLTIHIEWSNEVWNDQFFVNDWVKSQAETFNTSPFEIIKREIDRNWDIWLDVFGNESGRLKKVIGGWNGNPNWTESLLRTGITGHMLAIAPYVTPRRNDTLTYMEVTTASKIFQDIDNVYDTLLSRTARNVDLADHFGFIPVCYEGGQGLVANGRWRAAAWAAQESPKMSKLYTRLLKDLDNLGIRLFCHFNDISDRTDAFGSWGASEYQDVDGIKMKALLDARPQSSFKKALIKIKRMFKRDGRK
jgi:hypothetical protein